MYILGAEAAGRSNERKSKRNILAAVRAVEAHMALSCITMGILQMISPRMKGVIGPFKIRYLRTAAKETVSEATVKQTPCLKENDILINDRGFLSREMTNYLKNTRKVDTYIPAKKNMILYEDAVQLSQSSGKWQKHPYKKPGKSS